MGFFVDWTGCESFEGFGVELGFVFTLQCN